MENEEVKTKGVFMSAVAKALNSGGSATVKAFDYTVDLFSKSSDAIKRATPVVVDSTLSFSRKTAGFFSAGFTKIADYTISIDFSKLKRITRRKEGKDNLREKVSEYELKIKNLYFEIGKEGASTEQLESDRVKKMIEEVKEFEKEIQRLKGRIQEQEEAQVSESKAEPKREPKIKRKKQKISESQIDSLLRSAIESALRHGAFETDSDKAIFNKIANDLLDIEMDVKILAATELGKISNKAAVDILLEAVKYDNKYLTAEVINSLINIGDKKTVNLCKEMSSSGNHKVRINSLRGLYKLGTDAEIVPYLLDALKDEHAEVRRTAVAFLGWKDAAESVPSLIQSLQDKDELVRKAAVSALANIKDSASVLPLIRALADESIEIRQKSLEALRIITAKDIAFNIELTGEELSASVNGLKEWWQKERMDNIGQSVSEQFDSQSEPAVDNLLSPSKSIVTSEEADAHATSVIKEETSEPANAMEQASASAEVAESIAGVEGMTPVEDDQAGLPSQSELKRMSKAELVSLCERQGINCDDTLTKAEIINLLHS